MKRNILILSLLFAFVLWMNKLQGIALERKASQAPAGPSPIKTVSLTKEVTLPSFVGPQQKIVFSAGSGDQELGISNENSAIGPGAVKRSAQGFLVIDTFNDRILKLGSDGKLEFKISFPKDSFIQGSDENERGEILVLKKIQAQLFLDTYSQEGRIKNSVRVNTQDPLFKDYAGTFRSFAFEKSFYLATSTRVLKILDNGNTQSVPGIPDRSTKNSYWTTSKSSSDSHFTILKKREDSSIESEFKVPAGYDTLKNIYSLNDGGLVLEFEHLQNFSQDESNSKLLSILQRYTAQGRFVEEKTFEKNPNVELDQNVDIDASGQMALMQYQNNSFQISTENF